MIATEEKHWKIEVSMYPSFIIMINQYRETWIEKKKIFIQLEVSLSSFPPWVYFCEVWRTHFHKNQKKSEKRIKQPLKNLSHPTPGYRVYERKKKQLLRKVSWTIESSIPHHCEKGWQRNVTVLPRARKREIPSLKETPREKREGKLIVN